ncbi:MAG: hypothetical protein KL863_19530 [Rhizobium sp.]|nr:hypothetical protein [Rhizobium sp.]
MRLGFVAVTAITSDCGQWPQRPVRRNDQGQHELGEISGCATQQKPRGAGANPADLVGPRGMTPIDAQRRAEVIRIYRDSGNVAGG